LARCPDAPVRQQEASSHIDEMQLAEVAVAAAAKQNEIWNDPSGN
jgi:hypothetical protein